MYPFSAFGDIFSSKKGRYFFEEIIGWVGAVCLLCAFSLVQVGVLEVKSYFYQGLNIFGASGIVYISLRKKVYQPVVVNTVWLLFSLAGLAFHYFTTQ